MCSAGLLAILQRCSEWRVSEHTASSTAQSWLWGRHRAAQWSPQWLDWCWRELGGDAGCWGFLDQTGQGCITVLFVALWMDAGIAQRW